jgi:hypothetical protein
MIPCIAPVAGRGIMLSLTDIEAIATIEDMTVIGSRYAISRQERAQYARIVNKKVSLLRLKRLIISYPSR